MFEELNLDLDFSLFNESTKERHPEGWSHYHYEARKFLKDKCECCGSEKHLEIHHINQNYMNNLLNNIQTLCKYCHDWWHKTAIRINREVAGKMPSII